MTRNTLNKLIISSLVFAALVSVASGQDRQFRLDLDIGYRWNAYFQGSQDLYRSHVNLGEGPKLFSGELFFAPAPGSSKLLDRLQINAGNWGGEPYNSAQVRMAKNGVYELDFNYRNFAYFSSIPSFANPLAESGNLLSQHREDNSLRTLDLEVRLRPGKTWSPYVGFQRTSRFGRVDTTLSGDGDEFRLNKNLDFYSTDVKGGIRVALDRLSLAVEQGARWYRDLSTVSSGPQQGNSDRPLLGRHIVLNAYDGSQEVKSKAIPYSTVQASYRPVDVLLLKGKFSYSMADFRTGFSEYLAGNFFTFPQLRAFYSEGDNSTSGRFTQPNLLADVSAQWDALPWLRVIERFRTHRYHIAGFLNADLIYRDIDPVAGRPVDQVDINEALDNRLARNYDRQQLEGQFLISREFSLRVGHRYETKELELNPAAPDTPSSNRDERGRRLFDWNRNVLLLGGTYRLSSRNWVSVDYERGRTNQPIYRTEVTDFERVILIGRYAPIESLEFSGRLTLFDHDEASLDFTSENRQYGLQVSYRPIERVGVVGQWDQTRYDTEIPYLIPQTFRWDVFSYREKANYGNLFLDVLMWRNSRLNLGYSVWGNSGSFPLNYHQPFAKLEVPFGERYSGYVQWNYYGYNEKVRFAPQDYRTHLAIVGLRVSLGD